MKRTDPSLRRDGPDREHARGQARLTRLMAWALIVALAVILAGHLIYWDTMTALVGTAGAVLAVTVAVAGMIALAIWWRRAGR